MDGTSGVDPGAAIEMLVNWRQTWHLLPMLTRYHHLRSATARLAASAAEQQAYLQGLLLPVAIDEDSSAYCCDELGLEFEDYFISVEHMLAAGELSAQQAEALRSLNAILEAWSGQQHADFWRSDALQSDPRWSAVRTRAQAALEMLPVRDEPNGS